MARSAETRAVFVRGCLRGRGGYGGPVRVAAGMRVGLWVADVASLVGSADPARVDRRAQWRRLIDPEQSGRSHLEDRPNLLPGAAVGQEKLDHPAIGDDVWEILELPEVAAVDQVLRADLLDDPRRVERSGLMQWERHRAQAAEHQL